MSDNISRIISPEYAGPAFYASPSASSLPIPEFSKRSSTALGVSTQLSLGARKSPLDAITHIEQASSDSDQSSKSSTRSKSVSFTSDTKSNDGKRAISATKEQDKSIDMVRGNSSSCSISSCLTHHTQKFKTALAASAQRSAAFEKLAKRVGEDNEAQAKRETAQHQASEILELRQRQQVIIDRIMRRSAKVTFRYTPQEIIDIRNQKPTIPANVQRQAQEMQQMWMNQQIRTISQQAAEHLVMLERSTNHLLQPATTRLEQNLAKQQEILQQRLDEINEEIKREEGNLADDELGLTSSSDETTLIDTVIDRDEYQYQEVILPSNHRLAANSLETIFEESEETAVEDSNEADQKAPEIEQTGKAEEEAEDFDEFEELEDEGYYSIEEMVEEQEDEAYFSMEE
ncbi:hypothetical protein HO133_005943 [Letharia lupina]|uniref:Uncharacterized protein n=1 Tax=Letharia lupina TaxID=560253 RepID=A0A8H6C812_9LECA|nr:uncharacterized protein HO133_005943 [Letharia lupina]KAF6218592.1 hypothetical protein HO133_005943 [Letharia lupina]